jgi:Sulfotransferase family
MNALTVAGLEAEARVATGLADFGPDTGWREGFGRLVAAVEAMKPSDQLRRIAQHNIMGQLCTRLRFVEDDRNHSEIAHQDVGSPLIVVGLPRTGTTICYDLLCLDPVARAPREWEWYVPWPPTEAATIDSDPRIAQVQAIYQNWLTHAPQLADIQRMDCTQPGECNHGMQYHFASTNFWAELGVPEFTKWLIEEVPAGQYVSHKRLLQNFQWRGPKGRWTLKSPQHLFDLPGLVNAYPGAMLVWTHRDPVLTFSSLASMVAGFQKAFGGGENLHEIGRSVFEIWSAAMARGTAARDNDPTLEARIIDMAHMDVIADPKESIRRIYDHFGLTFSDEHIARIDSFLAENPAAKRMGKHKHSPEQFGIKVEHVHERLSDYYARFGHLLGRT